MSAAQCTTKHIKTVLSSESVASHRIAHGCSLCRPNPTSNMYMTEEGGLAPTQLHSATFTKRKTPKQLRHASIRPYYAAAPGILRGIRRETIRRTGTMHQETSSSRTTNKGTRDRKSFETPKRYLELRTCVSLSMMPRKSRRNPCGPGTNFFLSDIT